jgi:hypothetical protein
MEAMYTLNGRRGVDWDCLDEVYKVLAGHQFQSLKALYIHIGSPHGDIFWEGEDDLVVLRSKDMVDENPPLAARGASVSYSKLDGDVCMFCPE